MASKKLPTAQRCVKMLIDTHAHLNDPSLYADYQGAIKRAADAGVKEIINVGFDYPSSVMAVRLAEKHDNLWAMVGVHPHDADSYNAEIENKIKALAASSKVVAIGEIGLDFYYDNSPRELQREVFRKQIALARELNKPIAIHDRDAHGNLLQILRERDSRGVGGILHCFSGSYEMAEECIELGFYISFGGPVTFKNAVNVQAVAARVPLERVLVETDCPYLSPHHLRGKLNEPANLVYVAQKLAELRQCSYEDICLITTENARRLLFNSNKICNQGKLL